jgi:hypothetical protein
VKPVLLSSAIILVDLIPIQEECSFMLRKFLASMLPVLILAVLVGCGGAAVPAGPPPTPTFSTSSFGIVTGRAFWAQTNTGIADATFTLTNVEDDSIVLEATTDAQGVYTFADVEPGQYDVDYSGPLAGGPTPCENMQYKFSQIAEKAAFGKTSSEMRGDVQYFNITAPGSWIIDAGETFVLDLSFTCGG